LPAQSWDSGTAQPPRPRQGFLLMQQFESTAGAVAGAALGELGAAGALADGASAALVRVGAVALEGAPGVPPEAWLAVRSQWLMHNVRAASCAARGAARGEGRPPAGEGSGDVAPAG